MTAKHLLVYNIIKTKQRLTFDIFYQDPAVTFDGDDDGSYFKFVASNGYEVISRSRMDIQTERLWLLGAKSKDEQRSGSMVFSSDAKRDSAYLAFIQAIDEWAEHNGGVARQENEPAPADIIDFIDALAKCRDTFSPPLPGDPSEQYWAAAMSDPLEVPAYIANRVQQIKSGHGTIVAAADRFT